MPVMHSFPPAPPLVQSGKAERLIDPRRLTTQQRQMIWRGIQTLDPALADQLKNDANLQCLKDAFNATVRFSAADAKRFIEIGQKTRNRTQQQ